MPARRGTSGRGPCPRRRDQKAQRAAARADSKASITSDTGPTFTLFSKFPLELRNIIWKHAIPQPEYVRIKIIRAPRVGQQHVLLDKSPSFIISSSGDRSQRWVQDLLEVYVSAAMKESRELYLKDRTVALATTENGVMRFSSETMVWIVNSEELYLKTFKEQLLELFIEGDKLRDYLGEVKRFGVSVGEWVVEISQSDSALKLAATHELPRYFRSIEQTTFARGENFRAGSRSFYELNTALLSLRENVCVEETWRLEFALMKTRGSKVTWYKTAAAIERARVREEGTA